MKRPKLKDLRVDMKQTQKIRQMMADAKKIKITFCIDKDSLDKLRAMAIEKGSKYQTMLNHILKLYLDANNTLEERVLHLEQDVMLLKNKTKKAA